MGTTTGKTSITQTDFLLNDTGVAASAVDNLFGGAATIHTLFITNAGAVAYVKIYDHVDPNVGSTVPDIILTVPASTQTVWNIIEGVELTNVSYACVSAGGTAGTDAPAGAVTLHMVVW